MRTETYGLILAMIRATPATPADKVAECGACGFRWNDTITSALTPAPSGRCPNEYNHESQADKDADAASMARMSRLAAYIAGIEE